MLSMLEEFDVFVNVNFLIWNSVLKSFLRNLATDKGKRVRFIENEYNRTGIAGDQELGVLQSA